MTPEQYFKAYSYKNWAETRSGYNPMIEMFSNTRFFTTRID